MDWWLLLALWLIVIVVLSLLTQRALDRLQRTHESRYISTQLAKELSFSSDELTRLARLYAVTGQDGYEREFWQVLEVRNGRRPRKDGRTIALRTLMEQAGFTEREFSLLKEAEDLSNVLVKTEEIAMHAAKGLFDDGSGGFRVRGEPDLAMAARMMHGEDYQRAKSMIMGRIEAFEHEISERTSRAIGERTREYERYAYVTLLALPAMFVLAVISFFLMKRQFARPLRPIVDTLRAGGSALTGAAERILATSEALHAGARTQAASLVQTTGSLAALASGAQQNAGLARQARKSAANARAGAEAGVREMGEMSAVIHGLQAVGTELEHSMREIRKSSQEVFQIAQAVDHIAFQTHILSLNAAVEAARAGVAGRGFAVVAGEVRNLSQSSAKAAKDTAALIESALAKGEQGTRIMQQVSASLDQLIRTTGQVDHRLKDIKREAVSVDTGMQQVVESSDQQSESIERIRGAVGEVDRVIQGSVSRADESSRAAGSLITQAQRLTDAVVKIETLVGSGQPAKKREPAAAPRARPAATATAPLTSLRRDPVLLDQRTILG